jgi:hypothetical protein
MLEETEKTRFRAEEEFRATIREEIAARAKPESPAAKFWGFLNSQFGGWLLGTVLVGGVSYSLTVINDAKHSAELQQLKDRTTAREDGQTVSNVLPHLGSERPAVAELAAALLTHLSYHGVDKSLGDSLRSTLETYQQQGSQKGASDAARAGAQVSAAIQDASVKEPGIVMPEGSVVSDVCAPLSSKMLARRNSDPTFSTSPNRVYVHIADESQRPVAERLVQRIKQQGYLARDVENVGYRSSPKQSEVRYFNPEDAALAKAVLDLAKAENVESLASAPKCPPLYARMRHIELFFSGAVTKT